MERASQIKQDYERAMAVIYRRQNPVGQYKWTCWTQVHLDRVPPGMKYNGQPIRSQCLKGGDGITKLPKFTDNGNFEMVEGIKTLKPVYCCNFLCYQVYQEYRVTQKVR